MKGCVETTRGHDRWSTSMYNQGILAYHADDAQSYVKACDKRQHFNKTSWLNNTKGSRRAPNPHPNGMDRQPRAHGHLILILTGWINNQGYRRSRMSTVLDSHPKLSPTYRMDWRSRMPTGTWSSSKTKSHLQDGQTIKDAYRNLTPIQN